MLREVLLLRVVGAGLLALRGLLLLGLLGLLGLLLSVDGFLLEIRLGFTIGGGGVLVLDELVGRFIGRVLVGARHHLKRIIYFQLLRYILPLLLPE